MRKKTTYKTEETLELYAHYKKGLSLAQVACIYGKGISRQTLHERFKRLGLALRTNKQVSLKNCVREFNGAKYAFDSRNKYWRKTTGNRCSLRRDMYEHAGNTLKAGQVLMVPKDKIYNFTVKDITVTTAKEVLDKHRTGLNQSSTLKCEVCDRDLKLKAFPERRLPNAHLICISCISKAMQT